MKHNAARNAFLLSLLISLLFVFQGLAEEVVTVTTAPPISTAPAISGVTVNQVGGALGLIEISGINIPEPEFVPGLEGGGLRYRIKAYTASQINKTFSFAMVRQLMLDPVSGETMLYIRGDMALECSSIEGGNTSKIVMRVVPKKEPVVAAPVVKPVPPSAAVDPLAITTPVTLNLRDAEVRDVFRMLAEVTGYNIICDPSVPSGTVTISVKDVPASQVFLYLMRMNGISYATMGKTLLMGKTDALAKSMGMEETKAFHIAYGDPKAIAPIVKNMFNLTTDPAIDDRNHNLYITAPKSRMDEIKTLLDRLDTPGKQVMLQARIIEISDTERDELETVLNAVYDNWWFSYSSAAGGSGGYNRINQPNLYPTNTTLSPGRNMAENSSIRLLDAGIKALNAKGKARLLASPNVATADGKEANIALTQNIKYISARDQAGNPTYSEEKVGPTIVFTPTIGRDGIINLNVNLKTGEIVGYLRGGLGEEVPQTSTREVKSFVRVRDGEPFVVGGLFRDTKSTTHSKIPILGDIPLLGFLFRSTTDIRENSEVTMVVIPYIMDIENTSITETLIEMPNF